MMTKKWNFVHDQNPHHPVTMETIDNHQPLEVEESAAVEHAEYGVHPFWIVAFLAIYVVVLVGILLQLPV